MTLPKFINSFFLNILKIAGTLSLSLLVISLFVKGPSNNDTHTELSASGHKHLTKINHFLANKHIQLNAPDNNEHLNCLRTSGEEFLFRITQTPKSYCPSDLLFSINLENCQICGLNKTSQELGLSYEFTRMNVLASKAHPPTLFL